MSSVWSVLLILMLKFVTVVKLECTNGALLRAQCSTLNNKGGLNHGSARIIAHYIIILHTSLDHYSAWVYLAFSNNYTAFLLHESQIGAVRIRCNFGATSYSWSRSSDGSVANSVLLDTSSNKYTVVNHNSLDITFSNVTGAQDGGLYRCVYGNIGTTPELCVYVYGKHITL